MWNIIASNRILDFKIKQENYKRHKKSLREMKPSVDMKSPAHYVFLVTKPKTRQLKIQLSNQIQNENDGLVRRMIESSRSKSHSFAGDNFTKETLHGHYFKKMSEKIDIQNRKLVERLRDTSSSVNFNRFEKEHKDALKYKANSSKPRPVSAYASSRSKMRPQSAR